MTEPLQNKIVEKNSNSLPDCVLYHKLTRSNNEILSLALKLRKHLEPHIKDRRWRDLKVYKNCFLHSQAVKWAIENVDELIVDSDLKDEQRAVNNLNKILLAGYISHVTNNHRFRVGETKTLYFRFDDDLLQAEEKRSQEGENSSFEHSLINEISNLTSSVHRFEETMGSLNQALNEANNKIAYLESVVTLLQFIVRSVIFTSIFVAIYMSIDHTKYTKMSFYFHSFVAIILLFLCWKSMDQEGSFFTRNIRMIIEFINPMHDHFKEDRENDSEYSDVDDTQSLNSSSPLLNETTVSVSRYDDQNIKMTEADDIPGPESWIYRPVFVSVNKAAAPDLMTSCLSDSIPLGVPFKFESELFKGRCLIRLKDVKSDDVNGDEAYFKGRARKFQAIVQGTFKEPLNISDVLTGHEFVRPIKNLPPHWILRAASNLIKRLAPGAQIEITAPQPKSMAILAATSQTVSADRPGNEPEITCLNPPEDLSILGGYFKERTVAASKRKSFLANPKRAKKYFFDTESVYTFDFYQSILDVKTYSLDLGFTKVNLAKRLDGQPIQILSKTRSGKYLWSFQVWHEKLLKNHSTKREQ